jgi:hypothetical protein
MSLTHLNKQALKLRMPETHKVQVLRKQTFNLILTELTPPASVVKQLKNIVLTFSHESQIYFMLFYNLTFKTKNGGSEGKIR